MTLAQAEAIRDRACVQKRTYATPEEANSVLRALRRKGEHGNVKYRCPFCHDFWHVGHTLSLTGMRRMADAIRVLAQQQDLTCRTEDDQ